MTKITEFKMYLKKLILKCEDTCMPSIEICQILIYSTMYTCAILL